MEKSDVWNQQLWLLHFRITGDLEMCQSHADTTGLNTGPFDSSCGVEGTKS